MNDDPILLCPLLARNIEVFKSRLGAPANADVIVRRFRSGAFESAVLAIDGMVDARRVDENILKPCMDLPESAGEHVPPCERVSFLMAHAVSILPMKMKENVDELLADALSGQCVLLSEGCAVASVMDTRGFERRAVGRPEAEQVVLGAKSTRYNNIEALLARPAYKTRNSAFVVQASGGRKEVLREEGSAHREEPRSGSLFD